MQLDERSIAILEDLTSGFRRNYKELEEKYEISKRQIDYSLKKINVYLREQGIVEICKNRNGSLIVDAGVKKAAEKLRYERQKNEYIFSELERMQILAFMICVIEEALSLQHFVSELGVSKNTILNDLKNVQELFEVYGQKLKYTRQSGYIIQGSEFETRKILLEMVGQILKIHKGSEIIQRVSGLTKAEVSVFQRWMTITEEELEVIFTDEKMMTTPYGLALIYKRIKKGYFLKKEELVCEELYDTKEYSQASQLLSGLKNVPKQERFYIALLILSSNVSDDGVLSENKIIMIRSAIEKMLNDFENKACVVLEDKKSLINMLLQHLRPAYYRIKYNLTLTNNLLDIVNTEMYEEEFQEIHCLLKSCIKPLESLIGKEIPEIELQFITLLIASWFRRQGTKISGKPRVLVVCPNGITVSKIMFASLKDLFPEFIFLDSVSLREFQEWDKHLYDIVFAPLTLKTEKKMFVVEPVMAQKDKKTLRRQVLEDIYGMVNVDFDIKEIVEIVEKNAIITDEEKLKKQLRRYFSGRIMNSDMREEEPEEVHLEDLLSEGYIKQIESVSSWKEAMEIVSQPLLEKGNVSESYVEKVIKQYNDASIHIIFGGKIAVPHAMAENDVHRLGMSMLSIKEGVLFGGLLIHIFIMLAPVDEKRHLKAVLQLAQIAESEETIQRIVNAEDTERIRDILKEFN